MTAATARPGGMFCAAERGIHEVKPLPIPEPHPATAPLFDFALLHFQDGALVNFTKFYQELPR